MTKLNKFYDEFQRLCLQLFRKNLDMLLGEELTPYEKKWKKVSFDQLSDEFKFPLAVSNLEVELDYTGEIFLVFSKEDAIVVGGLLAMFGDSLIESKLKALELEGTELDGFQESCNQITGWVEQAFIKILTEKIHLKKGDTSVLEIERTFKEFLDNIYSDKYAVIFPFHFEIKNKYDIKFSFILSSSLTSQFGEEDESELLDESQQDVSEELNRAVLFNLLKNKENELVSIFEENNIFFKFITTFSQFEEQINTDLVKLIVIQTDKDAASGIKICKKVVMILNNTSIPIWLQDSKWDMKLINQSVKAGACYLLVSPLDKKIIDNRIKQLF